jgi:hypothetical protein
VRSPQRISIILSKFLKIERDGSPCKYLKSQEVRSKVKENNNRKEQSKIRCTESMSNNLTLARLL